MLAKEKEMEILQGAINAFKENINLNLEIEIVPQDVAVELNEEDRLPYVNRADFLLNFVFQQNQIHFYVEIETNITTVVIDLKRMFPEEQDRFLVVTRYVTAQQADRLKKYNIQFIDMAGNAFINQAPLYIFVKGNKLPEAFRRVPTNRAFQPTGLKLIYAFLCNRGLENRPYRKIAEAADVALGTVGWVIRDLKEMGYLLDMGKRGKKLVQQEQLFEQWVTTYPQQLRPKLTIGRYQGMPEWWVQTTLVPDQAQWGGEVAATDLTNYLKPQEATLYIDPTQLNKILLDNRLRKDPHGETEVLERFWKPDKNQPTEGTVNPMLVYADLLATGNQRNIEAAKIIYEQYIIPYLRED